MSDENKDMIKSAMDKNAAEFEDQFGSVMSAKMDAALAKQYDSMFGAPIAETEVDETPEDLETEE